MIPKSTGKKKDSRDNDLFDSKALPVPALAFDFYRCEAMCSEVPGCPYKPSKYIYNYKLIIQIKSLFIFFLSVLTPRS